MKLIKPSFEIWQQQSGLEGAYKQIEKAGRVCYKSEDKITEDSAEEFVYRLIKSGHTSVLEHCTVYLHINIGDKWNVMYNNNCPYCKVVDTKNGLYITTNLRYILKHDNTLFDLKYLCEPTEFHEKRITVKFILSRSIAQEYTRHRVFSFAMESQRYCNYSSDRFNNEVTFIVPYWMNDEQRNLSLESRDICGNTYAEVCFKESLIKAEKAYFTLLKEGWKPQQAREILPNACKTELIMTGFVSDWQHFFELRCDNSAHPQARELAIPLKEEFINRKYM